MNWTAAKTAKNGSKCYLSRIANKDSKVSVSSDDLNDESKDSKSQKDSRFKRKILESEKSVKLDISDIPGM